MTNDRLIKLASWALVTLLACSSYVYIPPTSFTYDGPVSDGISYRQLTRADFQAKQLSNPERRIDALTAISCVADTFYIYPVAKDGASTQWESSLENARFRAVMYPKASWWNPKRTSKKDVERLLEHEQTHFDIAELVVRQANIRVRAIRVTAPTAEASMTRAKERFDQEAARLAKMLEDWNAKYDLETKNGTDRREQKRWVERVRNELAATKSL